MGEEHGVDGRGLTNGHVKNKMNGALEKIESDIYEEENIFLFIPNIIGMLCALLCPHQPPDGFAL